MPTLERLRRFNRDYEALSPDRKAQFYEAVKKFVADLESGGRFRRSSRVEAVQGAPGILELTWAADGRATFEFGESVRPGEPHVIWRRVGSHDIFGSP